MALFGFFLGEGGGGKRKERLMNEKKKIFLLFPWHFRGLSVTRFRLFFFPSWFVFRLLFPLSFFTLQQRPCFRFPSLSFPRPPLLFIYFFFQKSYLSLSLTQDASFPVSTIHPLFEFHAFSFDFFILGGRGGGGEGWKRG